MLVKIAMSRLHIFADESGDFEFSRESNASRYFILCTVSMRSCEIANDLLELRRELAWAGVPLGHYFHASDDKQQVRDAVFDVICSHDFKAQATIMEKSKARPHVRVSRPRFYQFGWYYHFKFGTRPIVRSSDSLLVTTATLGTKKERLSFRNAVKDVVDQTVHCEWETDFLPAAADPCLQVADYCAWAIQRKWEMQDERSYELIEDHITYEYELWERGDCHYY